MEIRCSKSYASFSVSLLLILSIVLCGVFIQFGKGLKSPVSATTETILSISGNLYNEDGSLNYQNVQEFVDKLDFVTSGGTYTSAQIADSAGITLTNSFIFPMGYVVSSLGGSMTPRPIYWQAVYARNGYLTIWMIQNYTVSLYNRASGFSLFGSPFVSYTSAPEGYDQNHSYSYSILRDSTMNIYNELVKHLYNFDEFIITPTQANFGDDWQSIQNNTGNSCMNGLGEQTGTYNPHSFSSTSRMDDKFWIPSFYEAFNKASSGYNFDGGLWGLSNTDVAFDATRLDTNTITSELDGVGYSYSSWLRSGYSGAYGYDDALSAGYTGSGAGYENVNYSRGVRPAAHLDLNKLENSLPALLNVTGNSSAYTSSTLFDMDTGNATIIVQPADGDYISTIWLDSNLPQTVNRWSDYVYQDSDAFNVSYEVTDFSNIIIIYLKRIVGQVIVNINLVDIPPTLQQGSGTTILGVALQVSGGTGDNLEAVGEARITGYTNTDNLTTVHVSAVPSSGYYFVGWEAEDTDLSQYGTSADIPYNLIEGKILTAVFAPNHSQTNNSTDITGDTFG